MSNSRRISTAKAYDRAKGCYVFLTSFPILHKCARTAESISEKSLQWVSKKVLPRSYESSVSGKTKINMIDEHLRSILATFDAKLDGYIDEPRLIREDVTVGCAWVKESSFCIVVQLPLIGSLVSRRKSCAPVPHNQVEEQTADTVECHVVLVLPKKILKLVVSFIPENYQPHLQKIPILGRWVPSNWSPEENVNTKVDGQLVDNPRQFDNATIELGSELHAITEEGLASLAEMQDGSKLQGHSIFKPIPPESTRRLSSRAFTPKSCFSTAGSFYSAFWPDEAEGIDMSSVVGSSPHASQYHSAASEMDFEDFNFEEETKQTLNNDSEMLSAGVLPCPRAEMH